MARIPTYTAQSRAVQTTGVPRVRGIPMQDFSSQGIMQAGSELTKIGAQLLKAADDDAAHQAKVNAQLKLNDLELELQKIDPMSALTSYDIRAQAIIDEAGSSLSDNARATYDIASREAVARVKIGVQKDGIRRGREKQEANLVTGLAANIALIRANDTAADRERRLNDVKEQLNTAVNNRIIPADTGARYLIKYRTDADIARAAFDVEATPEKFLTEIKSGKEYANLPGKQRAMFMKRAAALIKENGKKKDNVQLKKIAQEYN